MALGDIVITGTINTSAPSDIYPTHFALTGKGGYRSVTSIEERNNIPTQRREHGMIVFVQEEEKKYVLGAGLTNDDWELDKTDSDAGSGTYTSNVPSTVDVGGLTAGFTAPNGIAIEDLIDQMLHPYQKPSFASFTTSTYKTYEVGETMPADSSFTFAFTNGSNVKPNTLKIEDVTGSNVLVQDAAITSPCQTTHNAITKTAAGSNVFRITATNTKDETFTKDLTVSWMWMVYSGTSSKEILDSSDILSLANKKLATSATGTYTYAAGGYKYFAIPESMTEPKKFTNADNGFGMAMNEPVAVSVTNAQGQSCNYRVYRSTYELGGAINMKVE